MKKLQLISLVFLIGSNYHLYAQIDYPGDNPGAASILKKKSDKIIFENDILSFEIDIEGNKLSVLRFRNKKTGELIKPGNYPFFELIISGNQTISSNDFTTINSPVISDLGTDLKSSAYSKSLPGKKFSVLLENDKSGISLDLDIYLADGSNYVRQVFKFKIPDNNKVSRSVLIRLPGVQGMRKEGKAEGSPIVFKNMFFAIEHPLSKVEQEKSAMIAYYPGFMKEYSVVWGVTPSNQLRRGFLYYVERERDQPYHHFLHYNSWYDISWAIENYNRNFLESEAIDRIKVYGDSLIIRRNITMKAFLFDEGWDDVTNLWGFHSELPEGFTNINRVANKVNAGVGVWMSPYGGYGVKKKQRIEHSKKHIPPFETNQYGFSLAGPVYYNRFKEVTTGFINNFNVCAFKFDGIGIGNIGSGATPGLQNDIEAYLKLLDELRWLKPDLYLSLTSGTWPSVYWLWYGDNIWRGGDDTEMVGEGSVRQKWITYRDAEIYKNVVKINPLYPISSLMIGGICIADNGEPGTFEMDDKDISDEIWSFFGTGTNLQELYINPHKLNTTNWDCLAKAAKWAKDNESVLADVHWIGGDPEKGNVYGFAAWSPSKAVLCLRNPSKDKKSFEGNVMKVFDLPKTVKNNFLFFNARSDSRESLKKPFAEGRSFTITLEPFEVVVLNALPN